MIHLPRIAIAALGALSLSACGSEPEEATGPAVASKVLEGSTSDAMIPYEKLRSEPPAAVIEADDEKDKSVSSANGPAASATTDEPSTTVAEPEPAPEPAE